MTLLNRFKFFGIGIAIGSAMVYYMLIKDREFPAWLPSDRVIEELTMYPVRIDGNVELPFPDSLIVEHIRVSDVLFDESKVREKPCREYQLESATERMRLEICDTVVTLLEYGKRQPTR